MYFFRHLSIKQKTVYLGVIHFKRETVVKIWYHKFILNYPTHSHDHVTPKLSPTLQNEYRFSK